MTKRYAVVLAAGQGTRMKSRLYKVLHPVAGKPMVQHVVDQIKKVGVEKIVTVIGHGAEKVKSQLGEEVEYALQEEQLGTGHAVIQTEQQLGGLEGTTLVVCGDTPLISSETMEALLEHHEKENAKVTLLTAHADDPAGYGRVIRNEDGTVAKVVEHKDASVDELAVQEINTGTYCFDNHTLFEALKQVNNDNVQGEYYLPDVIEIAKNKSEIVAAYQTPSFDETIGVNDRVALSEAERLMKIRINTKHMRNGVTMVDPQQTYISADVTIGRDSVILPGTVLTGSTSVGEDCEIGPNSEIKDSHIGNNAVIKQSVVHDSKVGDNVAIGPYAHIRPQSTLGNDIKVGNFVEIKKSKMDDGSKASHLSYIGDAEIGKNVNLGCGSITVNYDGKNKHLTKVEDGAFIGCNSNLIAPVIVGENAYVAAGSTITDNVPGEALSIARARQMNKEGYVSKIQEKLNNHRG
ncbi:bifunctional UDP-N-acetylglucosamine diphosphorylase/glucosamine-1-phosphate N-acetyltransferase GlmU [Pseudalkalibacillus salsuginis]|uniref:bifunctional UDP-N-acetylglucosamine diphosphorylase/glucosamine-1-phosphate N-acetyltransferase GlmU n=1 Tax=Pseudalkalibacillus salsuginis TaxID=2910972 RepID=UPI001F308DBE|nr:bifunctional UDP-N-acetylglucosamine diphosphorylase/glucosamine-1-phosphate N-acetyltransferase GlmU [Pseudalkalibacillus salsuginis]MCF6411923.1 bifunctional UDP-N-acetylglucosamine diphosphorylase/glucosamine-1-phosphate N-acetyltransferase GlmU [Pseudalkalibacillus salsuginis]